MSTRVPPGHVPYRHRSEEPAPRLVRRTVLLILAALVTTGLIAYVW